MDETEAALALVCTPGAGPSLAAALRRQFGSWAAGVAAVVRSDPRAQGIPPDLTSRLAETVRRGKHRAELGEARRVGARFVAAGDPEYPEALAAIARAPIGFFVRGARLGSLSPMVAVVGTRAPTPRGIAFARTLASDLVRAGVAVVSGLARGIDTAAHIGALDAGGPTVAVLGSGIARPYPPENAGLAAEVARAGAVVSEFAPTHEARPAAFPQRNRIVSGLSAGVVVVEAGSRSGALITAARAVEQGREVFAVPGPVDDERSRGPHGLIKRGAKLVEGVEDILDELSAAWGPFAARPSPGGAVDGPSPEDGAATPLAGHGHGPRDLKARIAATLSMTPASADDISSRLGEPVERVLSCLLSLELEGGATVLPGGLYVLRRRGSTRKDHGG